MSSLSNSSNSNKRKKSIEDSQDEDEKDTEKKEEEEDEENSDKEDEERDISIEFDYKKERAALKRDREAEQTSPRTKAFIVDDHESISASNDKNKAEESSSNSVGEVALHRRLLAKQKDLTPPIRQVAASTPPSQSSSSNAADDKEEKKKDPKALSQDNDDNTQQKLTEAKVTAKLFPIFKSIKPKTTVPPPQPEEKELSPPPPPPPKPAAKKSAATNTPHKKYESISEKNKARAEKKKEEKKKKVYQTLADLPEDFTSADLRELLNNIKSTNSDAGTRIGIVHAFLTSMVQDYDLVVGQITCNQEQKTDLIDSWRNYESHKIGFHKIIKTMFKVDMLLAFAFISPECHPGGDTETKNAKATTTDAVGGENKEEEQQPPLTTNEPPESKKFQKSSASKKKQKKGAASNPAADTNYLPKDVLVDKLVQHPADVESKGKKLKNKLHWHIYGFFYGSTFAMLDLKWMKRACIAARLFLLASAAIPFTNLCFILFLLQFIKLDLAPG